MFYEIQKVRSIVEKNGVELTSLVFVEVNFPSEEL